MAADPLPILAIFLGWLITGLFSIAAGLAVADGRMLRSLACCVVAYAAVVLAQWGASHVG